MNDYSAWMSPEPPEPPDPVEPEDYLQALIDELAALCNPGVKYVVSSAMLPGYRDTQFVATNMETGLSMRLGSLEDAIKCTGVAVDRLRLGQS